MVKTIWICRKDERLVAQDRRPEPNCAGFTGPGYARWALYVPVEEYPGIDRVLTGEWWALELRLKDGKIMRALGNGRDIRIKGLDPEKTIEVLGGSCAYTKKVGNAKQPNIQHQAD